MADFGIGEAEKLLEDMFAPWVHDLGLKIISFEDGTGRFELPQNPAPQQRRRHPVRTGHCRCGRYRVCARTVRLQWPVYAPAPPST